MQDIKLNIGAGATVIEGYTAIDRKLGTEAFPLAYPDNSVGDIRASHILEHLSWRDVPAALEEWKRVLKPGGRLRVAVPDVEKLLAARTTDKLWAYKLMGGQIDENDFHKSAFDEPRLIAYLRQAGLTNINRWESPNTDTAADPMSLNLEAFKPLPEAPESLTIKIKGVMSVPRIGWNDAGVAIEGALNPFGIHCERFNGVFWGQCMQRAFERGVEEGVDWILALDYDSMPLPEHLSHMMQVLGSRPDIDALAPLQMRRGMEYPLLTQANTTELEVTGEPIKVHTAHFGMTLFRVDSLKDLPKPWFASKPDAKGEWGDDRQDDDIFFWHQWRLAGKTVYVDPQARIGHLELMVSEFDEDMTPRHIPIGEWWERRNKK